MPFRFHRPVLLSLILPALTAGTLIGQSNTEINSSIQFNFSPPGARSLALAGAFLALADDATAAYTNPAGLTNLSRPELSIEGRASQFTNTYLFGGRNGGAVTNTGLDTSASEINRQDKSSTRGLSFLSLVYPGKNWAVAVYRTELANFRASANTQGAFFGGPFSGVDSSGPLEQRLRPYKGTLDLKIVSYGLSAAYRFGESLSLGIGVARFDYTQHTALTRYDVTNPIYGPPNYSSVAFAEGAAGDDHAVAVNAGLLWKIGSRVSVGAVYRQGPRFKTTAFADVDTFPNAVFHVPDVYGAGISVQPVRSLTVSFDYDRVRYSQLGDPTVDVISRGSTYTIHDGNEYRLGAQYLVQIGSSVLALRAGAWREPAHALLSTLPAIDTTKDNNDTVITKAIDHLLYRGGSSKNHYTGGIGLAIGEHFQVDAGADYAKDSSKIASLSFVVRL